MIDILLKYILWYKFLNDLDAESDFDKNVVTKKSVFFDWCVSPNSTNNLVRSIDGFLAEEANTISPRKIHSLY